MFRLNIITLILFVIIGIISGAVLSVAYFSQGSTLTNDVLNIGEPGYTFESSIAGSLGVVGDLSINSNLIVDGSVGTGYSTAKLTIDRTKLIVADGYVGINTTYPTAVLDVAGKFKVNNWGDVTAGTWQATIIDKNYLPSSILYAGQTEITDSYASGSIAASNYLPLIGGAINGNLSLTKLTIANDYIEFGTGNIQLKHKTGSSCGKAILAKKYSDQTATCSTGTEYNGCLACTGTNITCTAEAHWDGKAATTCIASHTCYGFTAESCPLIGCSWGGTCDQSSGSKTVSCTATHPRTSVAEVICLD